MAQPKKKAGLLRWIYRLVLVVVVLGVAIGGLLFVLSRTASTKWTRLTDAIRERGEPLTYEEILAARPAVPEGENGAIAIKRAQHELASITDGDESRVLALDDACRADDRLTIARPCIEPTRAYLTARRDALNELAQVTTYDGVRLEVEYRQDPMKRPGDHASVASGQRGLARLAHIDAVIKTIDGDLSGALDVIELQLHLSEPLYEEPATMFHLVGLAIDALALGDIQLLLASHELDPEQLARLDRVSREHLGLVSPRYGLLGERANYEALADEKQSPMLSKAPDVPFVLSWLAYGSSVEGILLLNPFIEASDDLPKLLDLARQLESKKPGGWPTKSMAIILAPSIARAMELHAKVVARFRCVLLALAAERFRMETGSFPESSEALKAAFAGDWPVDSFSGEPIQYKRTETGAVVYSIGENGVDDDGAGQPAPGERLEKDMGIFLLDPDRRAVPIVDQLPTEADQ